MVYSEEVRRRFDSPRGAGVLAEDLPGLIVGEAEDRSLNVWLRFQIQVLGGRIHAARFQVYGCPDTVAAASWVAEWLEGREASALSRLDVPGLAHNLSIPVEKLGKLLRMEDALIECWRQLENAAA